MTLLIIGLLLWVGLHLIPGLAPGLRDILRAKMGSKVYPAVFAFGVVLSIVLMVVGWRAAEQVQIYEPPVWGAPVGSVLILIAFIFFGLAQAKTNLKRYVRHPQLTGMVIWASGHLLANGDNLSIALFGILGLWALVEMPIINVRSGPWQKPDKVPLTSEIRPVVIGLIIFAVFIFAHPYLFGVSPLAH